MHVGGRLHIAARAARCEPFVKKRGQFPFAVVAGHDGHPFERRHLLGFKLCVASGDKYVGLWVAAVKGTYGLAAFLVGEFGDTAGVDHDYVGCLAAADACDSRPGECFGHRGGLGEVELASECMVKRLERAESSFVYQFRGIL